MGKGVVLAKQVSKEIKEALSEIMDKYSLRMMFTPIDLWNEDDELVTFMEWFLCGNEYEIAIEDICTDLLPKEYGKVKK